MSDFISNASLRSFNNSSISAFVCGDGGGGSGCGFGVACGGDSGIVGVGSCGIIGVDGCVITCGVVRCRGNLLAEFNFPFNEPVVR